MHQNMSKGAVCQVESDEYICNIYWFWKRNGI